MRVLTLLCCLYAFLAVGSASADQQFLAAKSQLETMQKNIEPLLLVTSRNMQLKLYGEKKECVAVVLHGLFQSPKDMQGIINFFYARGCNVVAPLLEGHWRKDQNSFYKTSYQIWKNQITELLNLAQVFGDKMILAGHSTGGLLALNQVISATPYNISHVILFSPAIKLQNSVIWGSKLGSKLRLAQNSVPAYGEVGSFTAQSEYDLQLRPAIAGVHVQNLVENIFGTDDSSRALTYARIKTPVMLISTENDETIRHDEVLNLYKSNPHFFRLIAYPKSSGILHDNIQRSEIDVEAGSPKEWTNPYYQDLLKRISQFLDN